MENKTGLDRITPSMLMSYVECPKLFYYRDWLGLKFQSDMRHLNFGTCVHEGIDTMYALYDFNFGGAWEAETFTKVKNKFVKCWKAFPIDKEEFKRFKKTKKGEASGLKSAEELHKHMEEDGIAMLKDMWEQKEMLIMDYGLDVSDVEVAVKMPLICPNNPEKQLPIPISMRVDGRTTSGVTVEFKTAGGKYNEHETRNKLQGRSYAFESYQNYQNKNPRVVYVILLKGLKTNGTRVQVIDLQYTEADMEMYYNEVDAILQKIANREFDVPAKGHSPWCDCRKYEELLKVD